MLGGQAINNCNVGSRWPWGRGMPVITAILGIKHAVQRVLLRVCHSAVFLPLLLLFWLVLVLLLVLLLVLMRLLVLMLVLALLLLLLLLSEFR